MCKFIGDFTKEEQAKLWEVLEIVEDLSTLKNVLFLKQKRLGSHYVKKGWISREDLTNLMALPLWRLVRQNGTETPTTFIQKTFNINDKKLLFNIMEYLEYISIKTEY